MFNRFSAKQKIYFVVALFMIIVIYTILIAVSRIGKTQVNIEVIPSDAIVFINKKQYSAGEVYLTPGSYTISARKGGFIEDKQIIEIGDEALSIGLAPVPESAEARRWLKNNPAIQRQREEIGGKMTALRGEYVAKNTPLVEYLPYTDVSGPFTIDYGSSKSRPYGIFLEINNSTPKGRQAALDWIRSKGFDPTDLEIRYDNDFKNPLLPVDTEEGILEGPNE